MIKMKNMLSLMKRSERIRERGKTTKIYWSHQNDPTSFEPMPSITIEEWNRFQQALQMEVLVGNMSPSKVMN